MSPLTPGVHPLSQAQVIRNVVEEGVLADHVGIDAFDVGEHHRADFAISAPEPVLSAIASRTQHIRLGTAVTVLSSDDPVRVFERFATLDAISGGRAEMTLGRGSFTESFPLFGYDLGDYEQLFSEKLDLMSHLLSEEAVTWEGTMRAALNAQQVYPKTEKGRIPTWIGVGGSPESVVRAAQYGFPLVLAIIGGDPARFSGFVDLYHRAVAHFGHESLPLAVAFAWLHRHHRRGGAGGPVAALPRHHYSHWPRAWLAAADSGALRRRNRARRTVCGLARDRGCQDRSDCGGVEGGSV